MPKSKTITRNQNSEALINEGRSTENRDQIQLAANAAGYPPNSLIAPITSGPDAGKWGAFDPTATDGRQLPKSFLYESRPASTSPQRAVGVTRFPVELNGKKLGGPGWLNADATQRAAAIASMLAIDTTKNIGGVRIRF